MYPINAGRTSLNEITEAFKFGSNFTKTRDRISAGGAGSRFFILVVALDHSRRIPLNLEHHIHDATSNGKREALQLNLSAERLDDKNVLPLGVRLSCHRRPSWGLALHPLLVVFPNRTTIPI